MFYKQRTKKKTTMNEEAPQCKRTRMEEENENEKNNTINEDPIYMDCNATTPLAPSVITTISEALHTGWANPSSSYKAGVEAKRIVTKARQQLLTLVNGRHLSEMTFMSGGTEANNHVIWLAVKYYYKFCLLYTSPSPRDATLSRMPSSA